MTPTAIKMRGKSAYFNGKAVGLTKQKMRSTMLNRLKTQKEEDRNRKSQRIKNKLFRTLAFKKAKKVMFYIPFGGEVDTRKMISKAQKIGKIVAVPYSHTHRIIKPCVLHEAAPLRKGLHGTHEPVTRRFMRLKDIDLVIVPGLAFDTRGSRLGRGRGCYDYFLHRLPEKAASVGLAFDFQVLPFVPATETDVNVDKVIFA